MSTCTQRGLRLNSSRDQEGTTTLCCCALCVPALYFQSVCTAVSVDVVVIVAAAAGAVVAVVAVAASDVGAGAGAGLPGASRHSRSSSHHLCPRVRHQDKTLPGWTPPVHKSCTSTYAYYQDLFGIFFFSLVNEMVTMGNIIISRRGMPGRGVIRFICTT